MKTPEIMTVADLAEYLRCSPTTIYRMLRNQSVPAFKMGSDWRFNRNSIDQWLRMRGGQVISPGRPKAKSNG
jgi:excisionase family DNA binding protein